MFNRNKDYSKINHEREERAKALHIADVSGSYSGVGKTCDTCIWWKRVMLRTFPNTTYMDKRFPCNQPQYTREATTGEQNKGKTKDDTCERWQYDR